MIPHTPLSLLLTFPRVSAAGLALQQDTTAVVIGCGPVGLCAITAACSFFTTVYAVDSIAERLQEAKKHGAIPLHLTDDDPVQTLRDATVAAINSPEVVPRLAIEGAEPVGNTPEEFAAFMKQESARWSEVIKKAGIGLD